MNCRVCGSSELHGENSYICKLVNSPCDHEWGEVIESDDKCNNCGHGYTVSQCKKCDMHSVIHWSEVLPHSEGYCMKDFDKNKCPNPKCGLKTAMKRPKAHDLTMICEHCKYRYTDQEAEATLGVKKVDTVDNENNPISAFINVGDGHDLFHSWYCLKEFDTQLDMDNHDKLYHKLGDPMAGCVPSGYVHEMVIECGND